ncbi:MAG: alpha/beta hydrolase, partial [Devosia sp.]|nr:alpha/beta hydrolase [Devosia sp.]
SDGVDPARLLARSRIVTHVFRHAAWMDEGHLLANAHRLRGIPGVLVQGRLDLQGPLVTAWELAKAWPEAKLVVIDGAGHSAGDAGMPEAITAALDGFARGHYR